MKISVFLLTIIVLFFIANSAVANSVIQNSKEKTVLVSDASNNLQLLVDYSKGCKLSQVIIKGKNTISSSGVFTSIKSGINEHTSLESNADLKVKITTNEIEICNIVFGDDQMRVNETWTFTTVGDQISWQIQRKYLNSGTLENMAMPVWNFSNISTWKGGILNTGGVVWCKYLKNQDDTYGVHTNGATFWEPVSGDGFQVESIMNSPGEIASSFSRAANDEFKYTQYVSPLELEQRYSLSRFVSKKSDVFAPFDVKQGTDDITMTLSYVDYKKEYDRGILPGIDANAVRELMNTTGRYGVVDQNIIGGNGWLTNWKCLHEPFFAQIGMVVDDKNYTRNFSATLDQERDQAIEEDGRVLARWHNVPEAEKSNYNYNTGYYDAPWGYTIDAQPGQIINTAEQFQQNGDLAWLKSHKTSSEKVLDWLIRRDSNNNGIFEMLNNNTGDNKCSDWIDVVWASFENAFVNAQMYEALNLWAECELVMNDKEKSNYYSKISERLKTAFNKPIAEGGFWYPEKKQYIYWRDKDGSIHGDNLVTPVNFAAIAFGICDDPKRISEILAQIEVKTQAEKLFHWPLCFESFKPEEVYKPVNWPFPNYENGDIFPTWGYLGVRSYVKYDKSIALKYIKNILHQYNMDGLSSQRYSRTTQKGLGEDILAGICTTVTALYTDIYGIQPKWNRMGLAPNMLSELNGTEFKYTLRDTIYNIKLSENNYTISNENFIVKSKSSFGIKSSGSILSYFPGNSNLAALNIGLESPMQIILDVNNWSELDHEWKIASAGKFEFKVAGLNSDSKYYLLVNGTKIQSLKTSNKGLIQFNYQCDTPTTFNIIP